MNNPVRVLKRKYDGSTKRDFGADLVDRHERWLVTHTTPLHQMIRDGRREAITSPHMLLFLNVELPLVAAFFFDALGRTDAAGVDAALPTLHTGNILSFVDLDLDIVVPPGEPAYVKDLEDFERRRREMAYPPEVVAAAWEGIRIGTELLAAKAYPFDGSAALLLGRILASEGPL